jgi:hypothetical protein
MQLMPRAARDKIAQLLEADKVMAQADMAGRREYEERIAHSEPTPLETSDAETAENVAKQPVG